MSLITKYVVLTLFLFFSQLQAKESEIPADHITTEQWQIDIALGYAVIENPLKKRDNIATFILPQWHYYGENFYIDNVNLGYSLYESDTLFFDLYGYLNEDGVLYNDNHENLSFLDVRKFTPNISVAPGRPGITPPARPAEDLPKIQRDFSYMVGGQLQWNNPYFQTRIIVGQDVTSGHDGKEFTLSFQDTYFWPSFNFHWQLGAINKSEQLVNYYYNLTSEEYTSDVEPLVTSSVTNYFAKVAMTYKIVDGFSAVLSIHNTWLNNKITDSILVDKDSYISGFIGINYSY